MENHEVFARTVTQQFLAPHQVRVVPTIAAAMTAVVKEDFDLMLVDYDLDDGKGDSLVRECLRARPNLKVIATSSHEMGNNSLIAAGASAVCSKMDFDQIEQAIDTLFK